MNSKEQRLPDYLGHMVEAIDRIESYVCDMDKASFSANRLVIDAVIRNIEVIGEASNKVRKHHRAFADEHPEVPWQLRNAERRGARLFQGGSRRCLGHHQERLARNAPGPAGAIGQVDLVICTTKKETGSIR